MSAVVVAHPGTELYGSDRMAVESAAAFRDMGMSVTVVTPDVGPLSEVLVDRGLKTETVAAPPLRKAHLRRATSALSFAGHSAVGLWRAVRFLRAHRPVALYVNTLIQPAWVLAGSILRIPVVVHVREIEADLPRPFARLLLSPLKLAAAVICNSNSTRTWVLSNARALEGRTAVVYNGKNWGPYESRTKEGPVPPCGTLAVVGRLSPRKGQDVAVGALADLHKRGYEMKLQITGSEFTGYEWYVQELRESIESLGLKEFVTFHPFTEEVADAYAAADIVVVPSRQEPFGTVALEAMAAGRPVVATRVEGLSEVVLNGATGLLFSPESSSELADHVESLVRDSDLRDDLVRTARSRLSTEFSSSSYRVAMQDRLREVIQ